MATEVWQLSLVAVGGLIGVSGTLLSSWLTSLLAERRSRREREDMLEKLVGKRRAALFPQKDADESQHARSFLASNPSTAEISFMIGYLEKNTERIEKSDSETHRLERETERLNSENSAMNNRLLQLSQEEKQLRQELLDLTKVCESLQGAVRASGGEVA